MKKRFRPFIVLLLAAGLIVVFFMFVVPLLLPYLIRTADPADPISPLANFLAQGNLLVTQIMVVLWFGYVGSCFGSFLNVVAWRLPRGLSIGGSSHCPHCDTRLSFTDNLPIMGWLKNGGRCSTCENPISPRYLIAELLLFTITLLVVGHEIFLGGMNLPRFAGTAMDVTGNLIRNNAPERFACTAFHLMLLYFLFTFAIIRSERQKIPRSLWLTGMVLGTVSITMYPRLILWSWTFEVTPRISWNSPGILSIWLSPFFGIAVGAMLGRALTAQSSNGARSNDFEIRFESKEKIPVTNNDSNQSRDPENDAPAVVSINEVIACMSLVGLFLGWQMALIAALIQFLWSEVQRVLPEPWRFSLSSQCLAITTMLVCSYDWWASWLGY